MHVENKLHEQLCYWVCLQDLCSLEQPCSRESPGGSDARRRGFPDSDVSHRQTRAESPSRLHACSMYLLLLTTARLWQAGETHRIYFITCSEQQTPRPLQIAPDAASPPTPTLLILTVYIFQTDTLSERFLIMQTARYVTWAALYNCSINWLGLSWSTPTYSSPFITAVMIAPTLRA